MLANYMLAPFSYFEYCGSVSVASLRLAILTYSVLKHICPLWTECIGLSFSKISGLWQACSSPFLDIRINTTKSYNPRTGHTVSFPHYLKWPISYLGHLTKYTNLRQSLGHFESSNSIHIRGYHRNAFVSSLRISKLYLSI